MIRPPVTVVSFLEWREIKWPGIDEAFYDDCLDLLQASCDRLGLKHVCISNGRRRVATFHAKMPQNLMQAIIAGQLAWLKQAKGPTLFTGADCLVTRDPTDECKGYDLCITNRHPGDLNTGMVWVQDGPKCAPIWQTALDMNPQEWGQDQTTLLKAIRHHQADLRIRELPMDVYNRPPRPEWDDEGRLPVIAHFKGSDNKALMKGWYRKYLLKRDSDARK